MLDNLLSGLQKLNINLVMLFILIQDLYLYNIIFFHQMEKIFIKL